MLQFLTSVERMRMVHSSRSFVIANGLLPHLLEHVDVAPLDVRLHVVWVGPDGLVEVSESFVKVACLLVGHRPVQVNRAVVRLVVRVQLQALVVHGHGFSEFTF